MFWVGVVCFVLVSIPIALWLGMVLEDMFDDKG